MKSKRPEPSGRLDEKALIDRVLGGDLDAFRPLVEAYEPVVFGLCRKLLNGNASEAEDLSQESFLRAYRRLAELKDRRRFAPWLYQIARSLCRDRVRRILAEKRAIEKRLQIERWQQESETDSEEILALLNGLPPHEREVLELRYFEGLSYQEIAARLGLSFARVDHLIRQARSHIGRRMEIARTQRERSL